jgi:hypothetical protein
VRIFGNFLKAVETDATIPTLIQTLRLKYVCGRQTFSDSEAQAKKILRWCTLVREKYVQKLLAMLQSTVDVVIELVGGGRALSFDTEYMPLLRQM